MPSQPTTDHGESRVVVLTKQEIDRRIDDLVRKVTAVEEDSSRPQRIEAADLIRRVRPFLVYN